MCHFAPVPKMWKCIWRCQDGRPKGGWAAWIFPTFGMCVPEIKTHPKLMKLARNNKICMEHGAKAHLFPRS